MSEIDFRDWAALVHLACSRLFSTLRPFLVFATLFMLCVRVQCSAVLKAGRLVCCIIT